MININKRDESGKTLLHIAAQVGDVNAIKKILAAKADPNVSFRIYNMNQTPLSWANANLRFQEDQLYGVAKLLLEAKADINLPLEEPPLYGAMISNSFKMVKYYVLNGADITTVINHPFTPGSIDLEIIRWIHEVSEYNDFQKACIKRDHRQLRNLFHTRVFDNGRGISTAAAIAWYPEFCTDLYNLQERQLYKDDDTAKIMLNAYKPWSPQTHYLWDPQSRKIALTLLRILLPEDPIYNIISYVLFRKN